MIVLLTSDSSLRMTTTTAEAVDAVIRYQDRIGSGVKEGVEQATVSAATTTTILTVGTAQAEDAQRVVRNISVRNRGAGAQTVTLLLTHEAVDYIFTPAISLAAGWSLMVDEEGRINTYDANGVPQIKVGSGGGGSSPTTTAGDMIYHDGAADAALAIGSAGQVLTVSGGFPAWVAPDASLSYARAVGVAHLS